MNLGGRRADTPSTPPIPVPPPPPSAYGLQVPGRAPVPPGVPSPQAYQPPPPPAAAPSTFADGFFGGPVAAAPAGQTQFGSYGGPATAQQSQFGSYGQQTQVPYGAPPAWGQPPTPNRGARPWAKVVIGLVVGAFAVAVGLNVYDRATAHSIGTLPEVLGGSPRLHSPDLDQRVDQAVSNTEGSYGMHGVQAAFYSSGGQRLFVMVADVHAGLQRQKNAFYRGLTNATDGVVFTPVSAGPKGGSAVCGAISNSEVCVWIDNGTIGMVVGATDEQSAAAALLELRAAAES